jgi:long-chain acyl-CoA synthetase
MLLERCRETPERPFLVTFENGTPTPRTFAAFLAQVRRWAAFLTVQGVRPGDRVAFIAAKGPEQVTAFYAVWLVGGIAVPVSEALGELETGFILRDCTPRLVLTEPLFAGKVRHAAGDVPVLLFETAQAQAEAQPTPPSVSEEEVAALIYTSGSTGMPKGVMLTHRNFLRNGAAAIQHIHIGPGDNVVSVLPYWHSFALVVEVIMGVQAGFRVSIPRDRKDFARNLSSYQATVVLVVPRIANALMTGILRRIEEGPARDRRLFRLAMANARALVEAPGGPWRPLRQVAHRLLYDPLVLRAVRTAFGPRLRFFISGGAPLDLEHQLFFTCLGAPMYQGYGLTEATPIVSANTDTCHQLGSSGTLLSWLRPEGGGDVAFRDDQGRLGRHLHGELLLRGDCVMKGYWNHRDDSAKTLENGWLHTGDLGYLDADGFLHLDGRQGNLIVLFGGEKLHPEHVEAALKGPGRITEAMVFGEACKNVYAAVNVAPEWFRTLPDAERLDALRQTIRERTGHLAPAQRPKDVLVLPDLSTADGTLTATLKLRRHRVWAVHGEALAEFLRRNREEAGVAAALKLRQDASTVP